MKSRISADKILQIEKKLISSKFAKFDDSTFSALISEITKIVSRR